MVQVRVEEANASLNPTTDDLEDVTLTFPSDNLNWFTYAVNMPSFNSSIFSVTSSIFNEFTTGTIFDRIASIFAMFDLTSAKLSHWKNIFSDTEGALRSNFYRLLFNLITKIRGE